MQNKKKLIRWVNRNIHRKICKPKNILKEILKTETHGKKRPT